MQKPLAVLNIEDSESDSKLIASLLKKAGYKITFERVETEAQMRAALKKRAWELVISGHSLPQFDSFAALALLHSEGSDIPFIAVSGAIGEEAVAAMLKAGAHDFLMKDHLTRLIPVVERELEYAKARREQRQADDDLRASEKRFRALIENGLDDISLLTAEGILIWESPSVIRHLDYAPNEFLGRNIFELMHPDDLQQNQNLFTELVQKPASQKSGVFRLKHRDGTWHWVEATATNMLQEASVQAIVINYRDITERKQAEEKLYLQQAALEAAANTIVITDRDGLIQWANPSFTELTGYDIAEATGKNPRELTKSGKQDQAYYKILWDTILSGQVWRGELVNRRKDGSLYSEEMTITPLRNPQGEINSFIAVKQDVTKRKQAEEALRESEERFHSLFDRMVDGVYRSKHEGKFVDVNPAMVKMFGYSTREEMLAVDIKNELYFEPEERGSHILDTGREEMDVYRMRRKDGSEIWVEDHGFYIHDEQGRIIYHEGILRDITERKQAEAAAHEIEARYRGLFEDSPISLWEEDFSAVKLRLDSLRGEGIQDFRAYFAAHPQMVLECISLVKIVDVNKATLNLFGAKAKADLFQNLSHFIDKDSAQFFQNELISIAQGKTQFEWEGVNQTLDGRRIIIHLSLSVMPGCEDTFSKVIISMVDITARIQAEKAVRESEKFLRESQMIAGLGSYTLDVSSGKWASSDILNQIFGINESILSNGSFTYSVESWIALIHPDWQQEMSDYFANEVLGNHIRFDKEYKIVRKNDGAERWVHGLGELELDAQNQPVKMRGTIQDITERKQAEDLLRKSEKRYHDLFEDSPVSLREEDFSAAKQWLDTLRQEGVTDFHAYLTLHAEEVFECAKMVKIKDVNKAALKMYRAGSKENMPNNLAEILNGKSLEHFKDQLVSIAEGQAEFSWEGIDQTIDGELIFVEAHWSVAAGYENDLSKVIVSLQDITQRKRAEEELQKAEIKYRMLVERLPVIIYTSELGENGAWTYVSPQIERLLGFTAEEWMADPKLWYQQVHADDRDRQQKLEERAWARQESFEGEYRMSTRDGRQIWVRDSALILPHQNNGAPIVQGMLMDVTERKRAEEKLRESEQRYHALFEDMPVAIWEEDFSQVKGYLDSLKAQGITDFRAYFQANPEAFLECATMIKILDVNQATLQMYHADSKQDLYKSMDNGLSKNEVEHIGDALIAISEGKTNHSWEGVDQTVAGDPIQVNLNWTVAPGHEADFSKVIVTTVDITERKKAEAENKYQLSELEALYENGLAISRLLEPKRIAQRMVEVIEQKLNWHHAAIRLYDAPTDHLELLALNSPGFNEAQITDQIERMNQAITTPDNGLSGWVIRHGEVVRIGNIKDDPRYLETYPGISSGLYVPIKTGDEVIGSIAIESEQVNAFTERDANTLTTLANQAAISFVNARLYTWLQKELDERLQVEEQVRKLNIELEQRVKERTAQIEATKRRLELATHAGQIGVWEYNPRENKVIWDERMYMIHQISLDEFDGTWESWAQMIHPDDLEKSHINKQLAFTQNLLLNNEHRIILPDGSIRHVNTSAVTVFSADGTPDRVIGISIDITERKQTEQSLRESETYARLLFDAVPDPVSVTEPDGLIVDVNSVFEKQYNLTRDEIRGKRISDLGIYPQTELDKREKYLAEVLQDQLAAPVELNFYVPKDRVHTLELHSYLLKVNGRQLVLNISHDITSHKKAEETQRLAKSEMERALRIKNEFLANMSHELRTPLNSILGISESLEEQIAGTLNEKQLKYIGIVRESGRHLLELINDILDLSKIEAGKMELDLHRISVETLCQSSLRMIKELSQKKNLNVSFKVTGDIKIILADQRRLKQSLVNLLSNAVKFTPSGKEIGLEVFGNAKKNVVEFTVWDQGVGITQEDIKLLFKPFVQLDAGLSREYQGTGLGLALVAQMIYLHGGRVHVESEVGQGSRFTITLPWSPNEQTPKAKVTAKLTLPSPRSAEKRYGKILLVEDTDVVVQLISEYLRYKGYEIILAHNGVEGIKLAAQQRPDLILMDVMMPIMDGLEATRRIRMNENLKNIPIIALTALAMPGDKERCMEAGMNDYLSKPIQMQDLADMIEKYISSARKASNEK